MKTWPDEIQKKHFYQLSPFLFLEALSYQVTTNRCMFSGEDTCEKRMVYPAVSGQKWGFLLRVLSC